MSNRDAKSQSRQWVEAPEFFAEDLRRLLSWVNEHAFESEPDATGGRLLDPGKNSAAQELLNPCDRALWEYQRMLRVTTVKFDMWQPLIQAMQAAADEKTPVLFTGIADIEEAVSAVEKWAKRQSSKVAEAPTRSEILKVTIEEFEDELIVRTDKEGSLKLRGTTNIPMFMAFWRAPKHRLTMEAFLDIDPSSNHTYLERHRTRLCAKLQDVLLEVVVDGNAFRMQVCRK